MISDSPDLAPADAATPVAPGTPFVELDDDAARRLSTLIAMSQDLEFAAELLQRLQSVIAQSQRDAVMVKCLWSTALTHYGRAFEAGTRVGARAGDIYHGLKGDAIGAHRDVLRLADEQRLPDDNPLDRVRVGVVLESGEGARAVSGTGVIATQRGVTGEAWIQQLSALVDAARRGVARIGIDTQAEILEAAKREPVETLYERARRVAEDGSLTP